MIYKIAFAKPMFDEAERQAADFILRKRTLTNAGQVRAFEEQFEAYVGGGQAVAVSSCMAALHLAYLIKGIGPGDEVIVPALTHVATVHAVELVGATPVFVDCHPESGNVDPDLLEEKITPRTKGISVVHFLGRPAYMRSTIAIAREHGLFVVEDCALALGATHWDVHVGLIGDVGCFSFYPTKHITMGEGGILLTKHPELAERARLVRSFGVQDGDVVVLGMNYRMTELQGIIGQAQLKKLPEFKKARVRNGQHLRARLGGHEFLGDDYALSVVLPEGHDRDIVRHRLVEMLVETSVYYARPTCDMTYYRNKYGRQDVPNARRICERSITLSVGPHLDSNDIRFLAECFDRALEGA